MISWGKMTFHFLLIYIKISLIFLVRLQICSSCSRIHLSFLIEHFPGRYSSQSLAIFWSWMWYCFNFILPFQWQGLTSPYGGAVHIVGVQYRSGWQPYSHLSVVRYRRVRPWLAAKFSRKKMYLKTYSKMEKIFGWAEI